MTKLFRWGARKRFRSVGCALLLVVLASIYAIAQTTSSAPSPQADPNLLVLQAVQRAVWGPSLSCQVQQQTDLYDQQQIGIGSYSHSGGGEGQLEFGVRYSTGRSQMYFEQLSDGRMVWTRANDGYPPRRVYLDRVRQSLGSIGRNPQASPVASLYLAVGGQAGLLRSLYHRYRWYKIYAGEADGLPVWEMIGTLRQTPPSIAGHAAVDLRLAEASTSGLLPTDARIRLGRGGELDLVPLRIEYFRSVLNESGELQDRVLVSKIEYSDIQVGTRFDDSKFRFQDYADNPIDETPEYMPVTPIAGNEQSMIR